MSLQDHAPSTVNTIGTCQEIDASLTQPSSRTVLEQTRRDLIALRVVHGSDSAAGHHASNIVELFKLPKPPADLLKRQMDGLQRAMQAAQ